MKKILEVKNLTKFFKINNKVIKAVDDVSFSVFENETIAIVGESGSGKTTVARMIMDLEKKTSGDIFFNEEIISSKNIKKNISMVFQDPYLSLNPKMKIMNILKDPLIIHKITNKENISSYIDELLIKVNLPTFIKNRYSHEISGGQKQRIAIARAISTNAKLIILDECLSALDLLIQSQILKLLKKLQKDLKMSYLFISHDLSVVKNFATKVIVMHRGKIVEIRNTKDIFENPQDQYSKKLLSSILEI
jgi:ABC-type oligopeptide transport system ATPase subunit